jgi:hypothetical protein
MAKQSKGTMQDVGMDASDFYDIDLIKPTKKKGTKKSSTKKTSFLPHKTLDNKKKNVA